MASEPTIALITGGTSGIGRAVAQLFSRQGASVIITDRDEVRGRDVATETAGRFIRADLASPEDVQRLASEAGDVDVLVNNAGYWELGPSAQTTEAGFDAMVAVNFRGPFFLTAALAPKMAARGHGAIVNVSTMVAARGAAGMAAYGASKAALEALTRSWATEYDPAGVRVNAVALGPSRTEVTKSMGEMLDTLAAASPLGRANEPDEVAHAIAYLAGEQARPITGTVLAVDAGRVFAL
ncbi:MAG: family NAD(P)-dependent oxidoreductase [Streptosporangiaceae bacterium]|jgi:NAD(P)-dependent dehydrogenase (short-subunit alcohol dehydrogenase family)|nr:family NAD(P)-dependent oxidoreductase [Streptosporangiaceae bacterium]